MVELGFIINILKCINQKSLIKLNNNPTKVFEKSVFSSDILSCTELLATIYVYFFCYILSFKAYIFEQN